MQYIARIIGLRYTRWWFTKITFLLRKILIYRSPNQNSLSSVKGYDNSAAICLTNDLPDPLKPCFAVLCWSLRQQFVLLFHLDGRSSALHDLVLWSLQKQTFKVQKTQDVSAEIGLSVIQSDVLPSLNGDNIQLRLTNEVFRSIRKLVL